MELTFNQFYLLTNMGDLEDIIPATDTQLNQYFLFK